MARALVGHTGFVGGHCARQTAFDDLYNSRNIEQIDGKAYDLLVCCGAPAEKWRANREPEADRQCLGRLMACLARVRAARVVLISTVDVLPVPVGTDEAAPVEVVRLAPYGKHRYELEVFLRERFPTLTVRLPGLFGSGLKKNIIYDFLNLNHLERIDARAVYQFYNLNGLWRDVGVALGAGLELVHFATEPVTVAEVAAHAFGTRFVNTLAGEPARYDFRTKYAALYGGADGYLQTKDAVLDGIRDFVAEHRMKRCA